MDSNGTEAYLRWTRVFVTLVGLGCLVGIAVPAGLGWDFANFYDAGRRVAAGQGADLYSPLNTISGQPPQGSMGFFGTPLSALLYVPLAFLPPRAALVAFKIENVLAFAAIYLVLVRFYRGVIAGTELEQSRFTALFAFLFLIFQPFWTVFRVGGQTTPTMLLVLAVGLVAHTNGRFWISALSVVLAALIKPSLAPAVIFIAAISEWAFTWRMGALWIAAGALSLLVFGWQVHVSFVNTMLTALGSVLSWHYNSSLYVWLDVLRAHARDVWHSGTLEMVFQGLTYALRTAVTATVVWFAWQARRPTFSAAARRHLTFLLMMVFYLAFSSTVFEHYLSNLFPFLIFIVASAPSFSREAQRLVGVIFIFSIAQNLILVNVVRYGFNIDTLGELVAAGLIKGAPLILTMVLLWRYPREVLESARRITGGAEITTDQR